MSDVPIREPKPEFQPQPSDPKWLVDAVRMHGHLGPWAVVGLRLGQAVLADLDCKGYFDVRIEVAGPVARPPPRCIVDGLQFSTGATMGKDTIHVQLADEFEIRATNTKTGRTIRYRLSASFLTAVSDLSGRDQVEALARRVARQPIEDLAVRQD